MDEILNAIVDFVLTTDYSSILPDAAQAAIRHNLDGIGCAAGAFDSEPARIARSMAAGVTGPRRASLYGLAEPTLPELAIFANTLMNRYLDFNDTARQTHPNDMVPAQIAFGELNGRSGKDVIVAIYLAYEVADSISREHMVRDRGWDQGMQCALGATAGMAKLMGLNALETANALSLAITPNIPLRVVRTGQLSHLKGSATAHAIMAAAFATMLAQQGMTGPPEPFVGIDGVFDQVTGRFAIDLGVCGAGESAVERAMFKYYPAEFGSQVAVHVARGLADMVDVNQIESVEVVTYELAWKDIGGGQGDAEAKWDPQNRESADHSLPYLVAIAMIDGEISVESFSNERIFDPRVRKLMQKIHVRADAEMTERSIPRPSRDREWPVRITLTLADGREFSDELHRPRGRADDSMSDSDLNEKFDSMVSGVLSPGDRALLRQKLWKLDYESSLDEIGSLLRRFHAG